MIRNMAMVRTGKIDYCKRRIEKTPKGNLQDLRRGVLTGGLRSAVRSIICIQLVFSCTNPLRASASGVEARRPNFLFICTDDQRWDAMGVVQREQGERARFPWLRTPNMDRLASDGIRLRNAFVVNSLCSPSRACFLTGRYNHFNGVANNHSPFPRQNLTYAKLLRSAGYTTGYVGKWHMGSQAGRRPAFDYSASYVGQGVYVDCPFEIDGIATPTHGWVDDCSTDLAIAFMEKNRSRPFALVVGFKAPHGPSLPPDRAKDRFPGEVSRAAFNQDVPVIYTSAMAARYQARKRELQEGVRLTDGNPPYFRCISAVDDNLGRLLAALDNFQLADDTVVIFTSDNGYQLVEHLVDDKRSAYEESMRIPLLVRYPRLGIKGKLVNEMVLNIDLAPTLLDFAGVPIPRGMQGRSWRPLLEGKPVEWRTSWLYEYFHEANFETPTILAVRTDSAKLVKYPGHREWTELFDLTSDPYETVNLVNTPSHKDLLARMEAEFEKQKAEVGYKVPDYADK